jgi:colicin import membrane protein
MNILVTRTSDTASPCMIMLSACLHGLFVLAIIIVSCYVSKLPKPPEQDLLRVKLVESVPGPPTVEKVPQSPPGDSDSVTALEQTETPADASPAVRSVVEEKKVAAPTDAIRVAKRKKPMRRVEKPKPPEKKPEPPVAKKQDPSAVLEKRLADLRKEVAEKPRDEGQSGSLRGGRDASEAAGKGGLTSGAEIVDRELVLWFAQIRNRVNSRWSVLPDSRNLERVTVVGVQIGEDGALVGTSIDDGSGDEAFDRSALRAVYQAAPFPKIPPEVGEKIRKAGGLAFRFTAKGMQ